MKEYKAAVFIGRFQPFHNAHKEVIKQGLEIAEKVIIVVGSCGAALNIKNPWTFEERKKMIVNSLDSLYERGYVQIVPVRDYYNTDNLWIMDVQNKVYQHVDETDSIALLGNYKDSSSYYLKYFPQWEFTPVKTTSQINATDIRENLFEAGLIYENLATRGSINVIIDSMFKNEGWHDADGPSFTGRMSKLQKEYLFIKDYKKQWGNSPFPPTFVTVDNVVICSGHVLLVKRKFQPGQGLWALPGGFIKQNERLQDAALRELKEETGIKVDKIVLENSIVESKVFDHPGRSLRGRTITHAYCIRLKDGKLPDVKGSDDAAKAQWVQLFDLLEDEFYEDHFHIIQYFINRN